MLSLLERVVNIDSGSYDKAGVDAVGEAFEGFFSSHGIEVERFPRDTSGDIFRARIPGPGNAPVVLIGYELAAAGRGGRQSGPRRDRRPRLRKAADLAAQLTNTEWLISMPGTAEQKRPLIECMSCHTLERVRALEVHRRRVRRRAQAHGEVRQQLDHHASQLRVAERELPDDRAREVAEYLATVNLEPARPWNYQLKTLPRPTGRATRVIITEYDSAAQDHRAARRAHRCERLRLVLEFRRALSRPARSPYRRAHRIRAIRCRSRSSRPAPWRSSRTRTELVARPDVPGRLMKFDPRTKTFRHYPVAAEMTATRRSNRW